MKIGIICYPTYGGSGALATELGLGLAGLGHEVHFITYRQPFRFPTFRERVYLHEVEISRYPLFEYPPYTLALATAIRDTVAREGLDIIHAHYAIPHAASAWIAQEMLRDAGAPPLLTTLHGTDVTLVGGDPTFKPITRFSILNSQGITAVSRYLRDKTAREFDVPKERIRIIPNFVDARVFQPEERCGHTAALSPSGAPIVMHVSNFRPVKRVAEIVEIFAKIRREMPARLVMVGDGPDRPLAEERSERLGLRGDVLFLGKQAAIEEILPSADIFLMASESESFGLAALEAMACGAPVVAYGTGGLPEVVPHGSGGFLLPLGDVDAAARAASALLKDAGLRHRFGSVARKVAVKQFAIARVLPRYEAYYRSLVREARG